MKKLALLMALTASYTACAAEEKKTEVNVQAPNITVITTSADGKDATKNIQKAIENTQQSALKSMHDIISLQNAWFNTITRALIDSINKNKSDLVNNISQMFSNFQRFLASRDSAKYEFKKDALRQKIREARDLAYSQSQWAMDKTNKKIAAERDRARDRIDADKEMLKSAHEHSMEKMKYALNAIGTGLYNFTSDKKRITLAAVSIGALIVIGYVAKRGTKVIADHVSAMLQKPNLVTETSRKNLIQIIKHPIKNLFSKEEDLPEPTYPKELQDHINTYIKSITEGKIHGDPFRHAIFFGKPGTGKTLLAKYIAKKLGMDYAIINAANLFQFADPVSELNNLFEWANSSSKGIVLFFDEVDAIAASRLKDISEQTRKIQNTFYAHTGSETKKFIILLATNQPELIDPAMLSRMDEKMHFPLPDLDTRITLLNMYLKKYPKIEIESELSVSISKSINGFSGREISQLARAVKAAAYSNNNIIDGELVKKCVNNAIAQKLALENYSFGK